MRFVFAMVAAGLLCGPGQAHEMFVRTASPTGATDAFTLADGAFDAPERAIDPARIAATDVSGRTAPVAWRREEMTATARIPLPARGTQSVGVRLSPKVIEHSADGFDDYLRREDLGDMLAMRQDAPRTPVRERFFKQSRTIVQAGPGRGDTYARGGGERVRFLLDRHPAAARAGAMIGFRLMFEGRPLANQVVWAGHAGEARPAAGHEHGERIEVRTDAAGRAAIRVDRAGPWYLSLIAMRPAPDKDATYETDYATLSFVVG